MRNGGIGACGKKGRNRGKCEMIGGGEDGQIGTGGGSGGDREVVGYRERMKWH